MEDDPDAEGDVSANAWVRQIHRWVSMVFVATVAANFIALARGTPPAWVTYSPLAPLALLAITGLYLFALPYLGRRRGGPASSRTPTAASGD
jgi:hypothetical protein